MTTENEKDLKYVYLSHIHLEPIIYEIEDNQSYILMDMYRQELGQTFEQVSSFEEEKSILEKYFKNRFSPITDELYRIITYPDNYRFDLEKNKDALIEEFINHLTMKNKKIQYSNVLHQPKTYGYQSFAMRYNTPIKKETYGYKILKPELESYLKKFRQYVLNEIEKDRNRYSLYILYGISSEYPKKTPLVYIDDPKELLNKNDIQDLEDKMKNLTKMLTGKVCFYYVESFVSYYLSEVGNIDKKTKMSNNLSNYDDIEFPTQDDIETPESFVGSLYEIIRKMPRGTKINNVENILRPDLIWRFKKYQAMLRDKYPNKPRLSDIDVAFHGTREDRMFSIVRRGLLIPDSNNGLDAFTCGARYGKGIYLSPDARFSMHYCRGDSCLLVCAILPGRKYVCNSNLWSTELQNGYDSHISSDNTELVLFDEAQVLPCTVIHFSVNEFYQDWWDLKYNGPKKAKMSYREKMKTMNKKEKKEYLASFAHSYLPYGFGNLKKGRKCEIIDCSFPDEEDEETDTQAIWNGQFDNLHYNLFQSERYN